ncbi:hypothetical protein BDP55DRAFT_385131 [Colletotrichum godetiae]|uniref:Uncharacterized protein n=1 Tax=Colletotrichum godetiae TaxID=1209918 RepID=A0AAJ0ATB1_9PEZI|nr:uncharacterized protein BDP55DRAFT_385131 [Colletotrichum godetiae]KAK1689970.1 hypothetical protein BDP55DRAFT_385131 [Colletotrichum godetiae]
MHKHPPAAAEASKLVNLGPRPPSWHSIANLLSSRPSYHLQSFGPPILKTEFPTGLRILASTRLPAREGESTKAPISAPDRWSPASIILGSLWTRDSSPPRPLTFLSVWPSSLLSTDTYPSTIVHRNSLPRPSHPVVSSISSKFPLDLATHPRLKHLASMDNIWTGSHFPGNQVHSPRHTSGGRRKIKRPPMTPRLMCEFQALCRSIRSETLENIQIRSSRTSVASRLALAL